MRRHPLAARRVLVVAPHPDDEAIGAFGLLWRLRRRGARLRVIVVTDGGASHPGSRLWPSDRLMKERRRETRRAMAALAIAPSDLRFVGLPDGGLARDRTATCRGLARAMQRWRRPDMVVGPAPDDDHADHRAVAAALAAVLPRGIVRLGYKVWPGSIPRGATMSVDLTLGTMRLKRRIVRGYRTQTGRITDADAGFTMTWRHLARFVRPQERFALLP